MTITVTSITKNQWKSVGKATLWIVGAYALTLVTARIKHYQFSDSIVKLGLPAYINLALFTASKLFQQEEDQAIANLPSQVEPIAQVAEANLPPPAA